MMSQQPSGTSAVDHQGLQPDGRRLGPVLQTSGQQPTQRPVVQQGVVWTSPEKSGTSVPTSVAPELGINTAKNIFLYVGTFTLAMIVAIPCWSACLLVQDVPYNYFASALGALEGQWFSFTLPWLILFVCGAVLVAYILLAGSLFAFAQPEKITNQALFLIWIVVLTLLGVAFLTISTELVDNAQRIQREILTECTQSPLVRHLHEHSQSLQALRAQAACSKLLSVEKCGGFTGTVESEVLKVMEDTYKCSGFCYEPPTASSTLAAGKANASAMTAGKSNASLIELQTGTFSLMRQKLGIAMALEAKTMKSERESSGITAMTSLATLSLASPLATYPPTLFSEANYKASCDGMAARRMRNFVEDIGKQTNILGIVLIGLTIFSGFVNLLGLCARAPGISYHYAPSYGTYGDQPRQFGDRGVVGPRYVG